MWSTRTRSAGSPDARLPRGDREGAAHAWARRAVETLARWPGVGLDQSIRLLRQFRRAAGTQPGTDHVLSDHEVEVAALVKRRVSPTARSASHSGIAARTVGVHVTHILDKLDVSKRSEIAAHVARRPVG